MKEKPLPLPSPREWVGEYQVMAKLGEGGGGTVFKARRGGSFYALKFIHGTRGGMNERHARGRREVAILLSMQHPHVVRVVGFGYWPDEETGCLYIVMEYVEGRTLFTWAEEENPPAREVALKTLEGARALEAVHGQQVLHRDVKGCNLLVRKADGHVVLVDFGSGTYEGAPHLTRHGLAPGTDLYRSPEAVRFYLERARDPNAHYPYRPTDDLYALGVVLYALLTDRMPFREDLPEARIHALYEEILHRVPEHPSDLNPRVPRALGDICMRLLSKRPEERYPSASALCAALEAALANADTSWDAPLFPSRAAAPPRRGAPGQDEEEAAAEWEWVMEQPGQGRGRGGSPRPLPVLAGKAPEAGKPPGVMLLSVVAGSSLLLGMLLGALLLSGYVRPGASSAVPSGTGHEVAPSPSLPEADGGAALSQAVTPAPVAPAMAPEEASHVKNPNMVPAAGKESDSSTGWRITTAALICTVASGCPAVPVRPQPQDCPPMTLFTMEEKLGIRRGDTARIVIDMDHSVGDTPVAVAQGPILSTPVDVLGNLPSREETFRLDGELFFDKERVYGRYTSIQLRDGTWVPVCLQLHDERDDELGVPKEPGSGPGAALIMNYGYVKAVSRFD
jgi:eukaryotic-like serine/threonine-protein kinase